ncbi:MAG: hypothetical protein WC340_18075 [Kiritimatiellia bacterium]
MIDQRANKNILAVSAQTREPGINECIDVDQSLLVSTDNYINLAPRTETNADEMNGKEEADIIYDNGASAAGSLTFARLQPNQAAFMLAYGLGACASVASGDGYIHTITPIDGDVDESRSNPSFTTMQRYGETIAKRRFASNFINSLSLTFATDSWVTGSAEILSTGRYQDSVIEESVTALDNVETLTLAANSVAGTTAAERLNSVQIVRAKVDGSYEFAVVTAVSDATPAVLTIESLGGTGDSTEYKILYMPQETLWSTSGDLLYCGDTVISGWTFPAPVTESPLRVSEMCLYLGGTWNGSTFEGGQKFGSQLTSLELSFANNGAVEFTPCAGGAYAGRYFRSARTQTVKINRYMLNMLLQKYRSEGEYIGLHVVCTGKEFATGENYKVEIIYPRLAITAAPISTNNNRVSEAAELQVLEDDTYGSLIVKVTNQVAQYAQPA